MPVARARARCRRSRGLRAVAGLAEDEMSRSPTAATVQMISEGTPNSEPEPNSALKASFSIGTDLRSVRRRRDAGENAHRRQRDEEGRQATIGHERAVERADRRADAEARRRHPTGHGQSRIATAASSADTATIEPIDRSISPAVRTKTMPTAMIGHRRRLLDDVEEIGGRREAVVAQHDREDGEDDEEADVDDVTARRVVFKNAVMAAPVAEEWIEDERPAGGAAGRPLCEPISPRRAPTSGRRDAAIPSSPARHWLW